LVALSGYPYHPSLKNGALDYIQYDTNTVNAPSITVTTITPPLYIAQTWVLVGGSVIVEFTGSMGLYCGFEYWLSGMESQKGIMWYNPPGGATIVTEDHVFKANIGGLKSGAHYYYRAMARDDENNNYYGNTESFTTLSTPPPAPPIFGLGNDYRSAKQAVENVADHATICNCHERQ